MPLAYSAGNSGISDFRLSFNNSALASLAALWLLTRKVFDFPWEPNMVLWWSVPLISAILLSLCGGWMGVRLLRGRALFRAYGN